MSEKRKIEALASWLLGVSCVVVTVHKSDAQSFPTYRIDRAGFYGPEHTDSAGRQDSYPIGARDGVVFGSSNRYLMGSQSLGYDAWVWSAQTGTRLLGLSGPEYTSSAGYRRTSIDVFGANGFAFGQSALVDANSQEIGQDLWRWDGTASVRFGFVGPEYNSPSIPGRRFARIQGANAAGLVIGYSARFTVSGSGNDGWVWNGSALTRLGLSGGVFTTAGGLSSAEPKLINPLGQVSGTSRRFTAAGGDLGFSAWAWNGTTHAEIGLRQSVHERTTGFRAIDVIRQNDQGAVLGTSRRFLPNDNENGTDVWIWQDGVTTQLGFRGGAYTTSTGRQESSSSLLLPNGYVAGFSERNLDNIAARGRDAWYWNGTSTVRIGLIGGVYTNSSGKRFSEPTHIFGTNTVVGTSNRYDSSDLTIGRDLWMYAGAQTVQIGLTGGVYTGSTGYQLSDITYVSGSNQAFGSSARVAGVNTDRGRDAWYFNGSVTLPVGLSGGVYTRNDGYQFNIPRSQLAADDKVFGYARRYSESGLQIGQDAWYLDLVTGITTAIIGSVRASDNYAYSIPMYMTENGIAFGHYTYFAGGVGSGEDRAFAYRPDLGFADLGSLVAGGLDSAGWLALSSIVQIQDIILGRGLWQCQTGGSAAFIMSVPSPASMFPALLLLTAVRRRRSSVK